MWRCGNTDSKMYQVGLKWDHQVKTTVNGLDSVVSRLPYLGPLVYRHLFIGFTVPKGLSAVVVLCLSAVAAARDGRSVRWHDGIRGGGRSSISKSSAWCLRGVRSDILLIGK